MRIPIPILALLVLAGGGGAGARDWKGIGKPVRKPDTAAAREETRTGPKSAGRFPVVADTVRLSRKVRYIPAGSPGAYIGNLEGIRCFNCAPNTVHLNLGDSLSREAGFLSLRLEVWNAVARPVRDRRLYDFENSCFFFGYKAVDTAWVGSEQAEIRVREIPCYPYLQRIAPGASGIPAQPGGKIPVPAPGPDPATPAVRAAPAGPGAPAAPEAPIAPTGTEASPSKDSSGVQAQPGDSR